MSIGALPAIVPVPYAMLDFDVVFRTLPGTALSNAVSNAIVAFQADSFANRWHRGWSVLVVAHAEFIEDPQRLHDAQALPIAAWYSDRDAQFARISTDVISGYAFLSSR